MSIYLIKDICFYECCSKLKNVFKYSLSRKHFLWITIPKSNNDLFIMVKMQNKWTFSMTVKQVFFVWDDSCFIELKGYFIQMK